MTARAPLSGTPGTMQDYGLTVDRFLVHAAKWHGRADVVSVGVDGQTSRTDYAALLERSQRLSGAFLSLGLKFGDRVATLAWNTQPHLETWYALMGAGLVCHTLNPRLTPQHLATMINTAQDRVLAIGAGLSDLAVEILRDCPCVEQVILLDDPATAAPAVFGCAPAITFAHFLEQHGAPAEWGGFDELSPAGLCFTSGTTGAPKGVLYTHRSNYLNTLRTLQADALALTAEASVLVAVPMFHANAWGMPFSAPAVGAKLVLPGRNTDGASLARLIRDEGVTLAAGVPTVWLGLLDHLDKAGGDVPLLKRIIIGGSGCPDSLMRRMEERLGVTVQTSWGMTELSPVGTISPPTGGRAKASGRAPMGLDMKLTDAEGRTLPQQRNTVGHLKVQGASVVQRYYGAAETVLDDEGYFDTGDLAILDDDGNLTIAGRSKDLIKSGGEWINPAEIEAIVGALPAVSLVAVIGRVDEKWGERPVLVIEPNPEHTLTDAELLACLRGKVADWWIPSVVVRLASMPLAATGKIDKQRLRAAHGAA